MSGSIIELFNGKNIITYNPTHFSYNRALELFIKLKQENQTELNKNKITSIDIDLNNDNLIFTKKNSGSPSKSEISINGSDSPLRNTGQKLVRSPDFKKMIKKITLSTPYLSSDKRWRSVGLTAAPLLLGSGLIENNYEVALNNLSLPANENTNLFRDTDLVGFTLFEDMFIYFREFLNRYPPDPGVITAAGGPFISLSPLCAIYHLPELNLFVRGEGENVFPKLINALNSGILDDLLSISGYFFQIDGLFIISDYNKLNTIKDLHKMIFHFNFSDKKELANGLEMNFSRGCRNNCVFCAKIQGKNFRVLPIKNVEQMLYSYSERLKELGIDEVNSNVININDDDILQDPDYARSVLNTIVKSGMSIWGIQSSVTSFFSANNHVITSIVDLISDKKYYSDKKPLIWIGTDTFLRERGKRLGKPLPDKDSFYRLISKFESRDINNYHYWISSDHQSNWSEFIDELEIIFDLISKFPHFSILPHSPFLIPYPSTPVYKLLTRSERFNPLLKYRDIRKGILPDFDLILVDHVRTKFDALNRLLSNEKLPGREGFFDYIRRGNFKDAYINAYSFIKDERISFDKSMDPKSFQQMIDTENRISDSITKLI